MKKIQIKILAVCVTLVVIATTGVLIGKENYKDKYKSTDMIAGISIKGFDKEDRKGTITYILDNLLEREKNIKILCKFSDGSTKSFPLSQLNLSYDITNALWMLEDKTLSEKAKSNNFGVLVEVNEDLIERVKDLSNSELKMIECNPVDAKLVFNDKGSPTISDSLDGKTYNKEQLLQDIVVQTEGIINTNNQENIVIFVDDYLTTKVPNISTELAKKCTDILGQSTTNYDVNTDLINRNNNIELSCDKISGSVLLPGETFSVYNETSPYSTEEGYKMAGVLRDGLAGSAIGGGVCQVSTTLYNAVIRSELKIDMRYNHTLKSTYVAPAFDATVSSESVDLKFTNDTDNPIFIFMGARDGKVYSKIYGNEVRNNNRKIEFNSNYDKENDIYTLEKSVYENEKLIEVNEINKSNYKN